MPTDPMPSDQMTGDPVPANPHQAEWDWYLQHPADFVQKRVHIYDATAQAWLPFTLWPAQRDLLDAMVENRQLVILKARQLGISWLCLAYALWLLLFHPPATILLFSLREEEAKELLWRLREMYYRLPQWLQCVAMPKLEERRWILSNGSRALAFSTRAGRSYTGTLALVDEADFVPDLGRFLNGVKPTIDAGGQLFLVSTSDKHRPVSTFKNLFRAALDHTGDYQPAFLPWLAHPDRDDAWHDRIQAEMFAQRGTHDDFYAEYPATPAEALAAEQLDRRLPYAWLEPCLLETTPPPPPPPRREDAPSGSAPSGSRIPTLPGLTIYEPPTPARRYVIGADPAEGNPNSDDSAAAILDATTWAEVATLVGKLEPTAFAHYLDQLGIYYNHADILPERNNHGHLLIRELQHLGHLRILSGYDGKPGWLSNLKGKPLLYGFVADALRQHACRIRSTTTATQLASIEASTLRAPQGLHDDQADAFALAITALAWQPPSQPSTLIEAEDPLAAYDRGEW